MLSNLTSSESETKTHIGPDSLIFSQLEYELKVSLHSSTARITQCFQLSNTHLSDQFARLSHEQLTLSTWVDSSVLEGGNTEEDVLKRGFQFGSSLRAGRSFHVGSFQPKVGEGSLHKALLCQVLVGRSYTIDRAGAEDADVPAGYKSFYIADESKSASDHSHEFYIKNPAHVLPRYLVQYEYDPSLELAARQKPICDDCESAPAAIYCEADKAYLCTTCDAALHTTKIARQHARKPLGEGVDVFGMCKSHPTRQVQYFCSGCHEPVCIDCTIMGSHAKLDGGEVGRHVLVSVEEYFRTVMAESHVPNVYLKERKRAILDQISNVQSRAGAVVDMTRGITVRIEEMCAVAKKEANAIMEKKLTVLVGDEHELRRQAGEIDRLESFLSYQQEGDGLTCITTWHLHQLKREELCDFRFFRADIDVQLDARVSGKLTVVVDEDQQKVLGGGATAQSGGKGKALGGGVASINSSPVRKPNLPHRPSTPVREIYEVSPQDSPNYLNGPSAPNQYGHLSAKGPKFAKTFKSPERKVERRTSDFFHEALSFGVPGGDSEDGFDSFN